MSAPQPEPTTCATAMNAAITHAMRKNPTVVLYGLRVASAGAVHGTTEGLAEAFGEERVLETPLSEDAMTGAGIGMAMAGLTPILVHMRTEFTILGVSQMFNVAAKMRMDFAIPLRFVVRTIVGRGWGQGPQHSMSLHSLWAHVPGLRVVAPVTPVDHAVALRDALVGPDPTVIIEHRLLHVMDDNDWLPCGVSAEIMSQLHEATYNVDLEVLRLGWRDETCPTAARLEEGFYPTPESIRQATKELIA